MPDNKQPKPELTRAEIVYLWDLLDSLLSEKGVASAMVSAREDFLKKQGTHGMSHIESACAKFDQYLTGAPIAR